LSCDNVNRYDDVNIWHGMSDTNNAIEARRINGFRRMTSAQKSALAGALTRNVRQLALARIRLRHPGIDAREARLRLAAMTIERATMLLAFGWDPVWCHYWIRKTPPQDFAGHEPVQLIQHELRQRPAVGRIGPMLLEGQQVLLEHLLKRCFFRLPPRIGVPARGLYVCRRLHD
jgi:hypothetical protein